MKAVSKLYDSRIEAWNILVEISIGEYEGLIKDIISKNEFQRKKYDLPDQFTLYLKKTY